MRPLDEFGCAEMSALVRLEERGPVTFRGFAHATRAGPVTARRAHERLARLGLIETSETVRGATRVFTITLTPRGRAVARHLDAIEALLPPASPP